MHPNLVICLMLLQENETRSRPKCQLLWKLSQRTALEAELLVLTSLLESALLVPGPLGKSLGCKVTLDLPEKEGQSRPSRQCPHRCTGRALCGLEWLVSLVSMRAGHDAG